LGSSDENAARLERINRNLLIGAIALAIVVVLLVIIDFAPWPRRVLTPINTAVPARGSNEHRISAGRTRGPRSNPRRRDVCRFMAQDHR